MLELTEQLLLNFNGLWDLVITIGIVYAFMWAVKTIGKELIKK